MKFVVLFFCFWIWSLYTEVRKKGLIIVDLQYDFASPNGSLTVFNNDFNEYLNISSSDYINRVNTFIENKKDTFDFIVYSIDYHPKNHCSFASTIDNKQPFEVLYFDDNDMDQFNESSDDLNVCLSQTGYQVLWPDHCIEGSEGSKLMDNLYDIRPNHDLHDQLKRVLIWRSPEMDEFYVANYELSASKVVNSNFSFKSKIDNVLSSISSDNRIKANVSQIMYVFKGRDIDIDSYSAFIGNDGKTETGLFHALNAYHYLPSNTDLTVFGIAYDYCVAFTANDAFKLGYNVILMDQLTVPVFANDVEALKKEMENKGIIIDYTLNGDQVDGDSDVHENGSQVNEELVIIIFAVIGSIFVVTIIVCALYQKCKRKGKTENYDDVRSNVVPNQ